MPLALILIGAILIVVAFNNTMGQLATELKADLPGYFVWALAIAAVLGLGYVPALKTPSRWLLALVVLVIVLTNYQKIFAGITTFATTGAAATGAGSSAADPAASFASSPAAPLPTAAQVAGDAGASSSSGASAADPLATLAAQPFGSITGGVSDALSSLSSLENLGGSFGFGGV